MSNSTDQQHYLLDYVKECAENNESPCVRIVASANLPTRFGTFVITAFYNDQDGEDHVAITKGEIAGQEEVLTRIHSECLTGDALGSLRCDCRDQLITSLEMIEKEGRGVILYMRQEGRGIGLINKIKAYALQDQGYDTVEADQALGFSGDERTYDVAAKMLELLKVKSVKLITNNPDKLASLRTLGIKVAERVPHIMAANRFNDKYLETKRIKAGHLFGHLNINV